MTVIQRLVLNSISDDYENVDQAILRDVAQDAAQLGITVDRSDIVAALAGLIAAGLAKAYNLSTPQPTELEGMPPLHVIEEKFATYFYITKKGMDVHLSEDE